MEKEILQAIKENRLYDYIANNYYRLRIEIIKDLLLELIYLTDEEQRKELIENLKDCRDWEE